MTEFWQFNFGHLLTIITMVLGGLVFAFRLSRRIDELESDSTAALDLSKKVETQIREIDRTGTQASQRALGVETELTKSNTRRLDTLDTMITKVAEMGRDIHWIKVYYQNGGRLPKPHDEEGE